MLKPDKIIESGPFHDEVVKLANKVGVNTPQMWVLDSHLPNAFAIPLLNGKGHVVGITKGFMELYGDSIHKAPSEFTKAFIAHELGHVKQGALTGMGVRLLSIGALPVVAVLARHRISKIYADQPIDEMPEEIKAVTPASQHYQLNDAAKDFAAVSLGLVAGGMAARHISLASEFYSDAVAAKAVSPEAMRDGLMTLEPAFIKAIMKGLKKGDAMNQFAHDGKGSAIQNLYKRIVHQTIHAHPSTGQRIARLEEMAAKAEEAVGEGGKKTTGHVMHTEGVEQVLEGLFKGKSKMPHTPESHLPEQTVDVGDGGVLDGILDGLSVALHRT